MVRSGTRQGSAGCRADRGMKDTDTTRDGVKELEARQGASIADLKARILATPEARAEYEAQKLEFDRVRDRIAARTAA